MPVSVVADWPHSDLVEAVASIVAERERCPSCNLTDEQAWWVAAELDRCPTCEDRDSLIRTLPEKANRDGLRVQYTQLTDEEESVQYSSAARFTLEGSKKRLARQAERLGSGS